ncbi:MAG TPA: DUF3298 domain-containing protein [Cyclobacteriaceae bacterium]|nr:DUF3298 domain-containing protein [Cyclobacteriaceae bacterium]
MKPALYLVTLLSLLIFACTNKKENVEDVTELTYEIRTYSISSAGACNDESKPCARFEVSYPVFRAPAGNRLPALIEDRINTMLSAPSSDIDPESIEAAGKAFISDFELTLQEFPDLSMGWYYKADVVVENLTDKILCISVNDEYFTGGAHGGSSTSFINFDVNTGKILLLDDILKPGYEGDLNATGERAFKKVRNIPDDAYLPDLGYEFEGGFFYLNQNYGFRPEGIVFFYNIYEIGPYVFGPTEILIPYEEIKNWLKESEQTNL